MVKSIILLLQPGDGSSSFLAQLSGVEGGATFLESSQMQVSTNTISWIVLVIIDYFVISISLLVFSIQFRGTKPFVFNKSSEVVFRCYWCQKSIWNS